MGEAWHHNHHAFPTSAFHGLRWWERLTDPTGLVISGLEKLGLVWNVVRISPERQTAKAAHERPGRRQGQRHRAGDRGLGSPPRGMRQPRPVSGSVPLYPDSSGAIVSPAQSSRSQYCSASSRGPLHTIACPLLWILSASR